jgi:hypothetical protein
MVWLLYSQGKSYQLLLDRTLDRSQHWYGCADEKKISVKSHFIDVALLLCNIKIHNSWENDWHEVLIINIPHDLSTESNNECESSVVSGTILLK